MGLTLYKKKRNFRQTPEPAGKTRRSLSKLEFVVQRHKASRLHYDFRLEMDGVLKSWAVPKGPSLNPQDKRLAMMVEDHPFEYRTFKGIIPEGNYGAGIVEIWDHGYYSDPDNSDRKTAERKLKAGLKAGNLKVRLYGKKLKGEFALVRLKGKDDNAWLLIKHRDEHSTDEEFNSEDLTPASSPINKWLETHGKSTQKKEITKPEAKSEKKRGRRYLPAETRKLDEYIKPMLAKETDKAFDDKEWIYEIKWDGYRAIAEVNDHKVLLYSRNGNTFNQSYPLVVDALAELGINAVLDGEIIVVDEQGNPDFQHLQHYETGSEYSIQYYVFDVLSIGGNDLTGLPLLERKKLLKKLIKKNELVLYSDHIEERGIDFFNIAVEKNLEGIMAKKADSLYQPGVRTSEWLKIKHHKSQEAIIAGFTAPGGSRKYFGALVLGIRKNGKLHYAGHTGTGFTEKTLKEMSKILKPLIQDKSPFEEKVQTNMPVTWVKPELVCEIKFTEVTRDGRMRHPVFLRLRDDKTAKEVSMENTVKTKVKTSVVKKLQKKKPADPSKKNTEETLIGNRKVNITNTNKVFWPEEGITKGDVIKYYQSVADYILPYLKDRPQSLKRNPNGILDKGFYHKDAGDEAPEWVKSFKIFSESTNKDIDYLICNNKATLAYMNNLGCIEINPWHSTIQDLNNPDYLVIDIDPSEKNNFEQVIEAALVTKEVLDKVKATSFCKTSGATGMHVYVPTGKKYSYDQLKDFAHIVCMLVNEQLPSFTSLERNLKKRGTSHIYLDHLQNRRGQTIASAYSLRPHAGATVSTPLKWTEVKPGLTPDKFNIQSILPRIKKYGDLFTGVLDKGIDLMKCLKLLEK